MRTAAVLTVGTATLAAFIGAGGLGVPIVAGLGLNFGIVIGAMAGQAALIMVVVVLVAQNVVQPVIQRQLERNTMDIHPIVSFGSTIVGSVVAGVLGATLSAPFVAMILRIRRRVAAYHADGGEAAQ